MAKMRKLRRSYDLLSIKWGIVWVAEILRCSSPVIAHRSKPDNRNRICLHHTSRRRNPRSQGTKTLSHGGKIRLETLGRVTVDLVPAGLLLHVLEDTLTAGRDEFILADQPIFIGIDDCQYRF